MSERWLAAVRQPQTIAFAAILAVAAAVRLPRLDSLTPALPDEVLASVDIHSVLQFGTHFTGEGAGLLSYIVAVLDLRLPMALVGDDVTHLRLIAVLFGLGTVGAVALLGRELHSTRLGLLAASALAVMPWHIMTSRQFLPASEYLFFAVLCILLVLRALRTLSVVAGMGAVVSAAVSFYLYPVALLTTPLLALAAIIARPGRWRELRPLQVILLFDVLAVAMYPYLIDHLRVYDTSVANQNVVIGASLVWAHGLDAANLLRTIAGNWLSYLDPRFVLGAGDPQAAHSIGVFGQMGVAVGALGYVGLVIGLSARRRWHLLLLGWTLLYPLGDALTYYDATANSVRGVVGSAVWALWAAVAMDEGIRLLFGYRLRLVAVGVGLALAAQAVGFASVYAQTYVHDRGSAFEEGYGRIWTELSSRGLQGIPITLHAGYDRYAMLAYFSNYRLRAAEQVQACYPLPYDTVHYTVGPRIFIIRDDPSYASLPDCLHGGLGDRDEADLRRVRDRAGDGLGQVVRIADFANDQSSPYRTRILLLTAPTGG